MELIPFIPQCFILVKGLCYTFSFLVFPHELDGNGELLCLVSNIDDLEGRTRIFLLSWNEFQKLLSQVCYFASPLVGAIDDELLKLPLLQKQVPEGRNDSKDEEEDKPTFAAATFLLLCKPIFILPYYFTFF